ncbi:hypothetical protein L1987_21629 [Smallanthus sonchifolius]|uniref:Uncharacterized protein n=1 Tax=Smallanthus sonchifolius TaxID=185202 RepID=A0ACB9ICR4_9ASTR|nr:hypothetical protein L1987_21629 [Smallanthus sonchifolius]
MLAISTNGARKVANISATCKLFKDLAGRAHILREVNFQCLTLTEDFTRHHHQKDLLCVCTQVGHRAATSILAKAILYDDRWFRQMIVETNLDAFDFRLPYNELLNCHSIVRSFIRHGSCTEIVKMHDHLLNYVISFVGYMVALRFGILDAIDEMCAEMGRRIPEHNARILLITWTTKLSLRVLKTEVRGDRNKVLVIFDKLFPSKPV